MNLTVNEHPTKYSVLQYLYPVFSRRAEGLSLGINLNLNKSCNWRCIYCQVPDLIRGTPERINLDKLEIELRYMLNLIMNTDYLKLNLPEDFQVFKDIALAGDGEPTLSKDFFEVVDLIGRLKIEYNLFKSVKTILITNGSKIDNVQVQEGLKSLANQNGLVWFKIDGTNNKETNIINQINVSTVNIKHRLEVTSKLCPVVIQTCMFKIGIYEPSLEQIDNYINLLKEVKPNFDYVLLYTIARTPQLLEGKNLTPLSLEFLNKIAAKLNEFGIIVKCFG